MLVGGWHNAVVNPTRYYWWQLVQWVQLKRDPITNNKRFQLIKHSPTHSPTIHPMLILSLFPSSAFTTLYVGNPLLRSFIHSLLLLLANAHSHPPFYTFICIIRYVVYFFFSLPHTPTDVSAACHHRSM